MKRREIKILGESVPVSDDYVHIDSLKFLKDNPRVYACTHEVPGFDGMIEEEQQVVIFKRLLEEPSVKNLIPDVKRHGGLLENILIRSDTMEVIEGNSRLAVYRYLQNLPDEEGEWEFIPCNLISSLTEELQAAFLSQIHIKGKTKWSAYEKANFAYVRKAAGWGYKYIAEMFGESEATVRKRVKIIQAMKDNQDRDRSHFSYYDVLVRNSEIAQALNKENALANFIYSEIRDLGSDEKNNSFTAQDLRNKLPHVLKKSKVLNKLVAKKIDLDEAYQRARINSSEERIKKATALLTDVTKSEVKQLERNELNALGLAVRRLSRETERIENIISDCGLNDRK